MGTACWQRRFFRLAALALLSLATLENSAKAASAWPDRYNDCLSGADADDGADACIDALTSPALSVFQRAEVYRHLARFYRKANLITEAESSIRTALTLYPGNPETIAEMGTIYFIKSDYEAAKAALSRAISGGASSGSVFNNRGMTFQALGQFAEAISDLDRAIELSGSNGEIWNNRANLFCETGNVSAAYEDRIQALYNLRFTAAAAQAGLRKSGFYDGPTDGIWGYDSEQALRAWTQAGCPNAPASRLQ